MSRDDLETAVAEAYDVSTAIRFILKVGRPEPATGCWEWNGALAGSTRRPSFWLRGRAVYVARLVLSLRLGRPLRRNLVAAHRCDNPCCVNPAHLDEATQSRNLRDAWTRGRRHRPPCTFVEP